MQADKALNSSTNLLYGDYFHDETGHAIPVNFETQVKYDFNNGDFLHSVFPTVPQWARVKVIITNGIMSIFQLAPEKLLRTVNIKGCSIEASLKKHVVKIQREDTVEALFTASHIEKLQRIISAVAVQLFILSTEPPHTFQLDYFYTIEKNIGTGASASVSLGSDRITGEKYAVKSVRVGKDEYLKKMVQSEVDLMSRIQHKRIVSIRDRVFDSVHKKYFLMLDICAGGDLFELMQKHSLSEWTEDSIRHVMKQIFRALEYIHARNIIHRDVKAENVLCVKPDEFPPSIKLCDFGVSRVVMNQSARSFVGTGSYLAPEILLRNRYGSSVDIWAAGCLLYRLLTGRMAFYADSNDKLAEKILKGPSYSASFWNHRSSQSQDLVKRLLEFDPTKRPSAADALDDPWMKAKQNSFVKFISQKTNQSTGNNSPASKSQAILE